MTQEQRLKELGRKEKLTDAEMQELTRLSPPTTFKSGPNLLKIGVTDIKKAFQNYKEGKDRSRHALQNGCYLEVISLRIQHAEFWLRIFYVVKNKRGKIFDPNDKRTFGVIINDCKQLGFSHDLIKRLKDFNHHRVNAIHKYLLGKTDYEKLREVCTFTTGLDGEVGKYVRDNVGIPISL